jgi:predicted nucleic acid-binding Zn ribbon protein
MTHEIQCAQCGETFDAVRSDARYCSDLCRVNSHRAQRAAEAAEQAVLVNENIDAHGRAYRLWIRARPSREGLIDIQFTSTFSGALNPDQHRVVWQTSLPPKAVGTVLSTLTQSLLDHHHENVKT